MPTPSSADQSAPAHTYDYAIIRVVPRVERGEFVNVGVILFCRTRRYLGVALDLDCRRLRALSPEVDLEAVRAALEGFRRVAIGDPTVGGLANLSPAERFHWLTSPRSTAIQTSAVHSGFGGDPAAALGRLISSLVHVDTPEPDSG